jgi:beta-1,2-mannobiose phosphorylase / 1,2-beta-oligomannan phosphorylase
VHWNRLQEPVFSPSSDVDARGVEDPRVTFLEGRFYMAYTAYGRLAKHPETGTPASGITPMIAVSDDLITWEIVGPVVEGEDNKDHALFPERVGGRFVTFHRRPPSIWLAFSSDLRSWGDHVEILRPRPGLWDAKRVGAGGVPIRTDEGWLVLYHGYDERHTYCMGTALLALDDPRRVLARPREPILEPRETWEIKGDVPNVVFGTANPVVDGTVHLYYGAADRVVGLASAPLDALLAWTIECG